MKYTAIATITVNNMPKIAKSFARKLLTFDRSTSPNKYALSDDPKKKRQKKLIFFVLHYFIRDGERSRRGMDIVSQRIRNFSF